MASIERNREELRTQDMDSNPQEEGSTMSADMTPIQDESVDTSQGTEDLQMTLEEALALRKNLVSKFEKKPWASC